MVAVAAQQGLGQDSGLSMPSRLCLGGLSEYSDQVLLQLCKLQGASILIEDRPNLSLLQSQQHLTTNSAIEPVFKAQERDQSLNRSCRLNCIACVSLREQFANRREPSQMAKCRFPGVDLLAGPHMSIILQRAKCFV